VEGRKEERKRGMGKARNPEYDVQVLEKKV